MVPAITDFFQTTFSDSLKKFAQPAYITIASIFLLLNFLFIFPDLVAHNVLLAASLLNLNPIVQGILISVMVLLLAYIFLSLSSSILKLMTGASWKNSLIGRLFTALQLAKLEDLERQSLIGKVALLDRLTLFPAEKDYVGPTALGNVMNATASAIWRQYGIDMTALWSHMENALSQPGGGKANPTAASKSDDTASKSDGTTLKTRLDNERTTLDFLVSMSFVLALFAVEQVLVQYAWLQHEFTALWAPLIFLLLAYIVYRAAVVKARTWGDVVQMVFDLNRSDLKAELGLRNFANLEDEYNVWKKVSSWLLWGEPAGDVFASTPAYAPSIVSSNNVKVTVQYGITTFENPAATSPRDSKIENEFNVFQYVYQSIEYILLVSISENAPRSVDSSKGQGLVQPENAPSSADDGKGQGPVQQGKPQSPTQPEKANKDFYILVSDPLIPRIGTQPIATLGDPSSKVPGNNKKYTAEVITTNEADGADQLLWYVKDPPDSSLMVLRYKIPIRVFEISIK